MEARESNTLAAPVAQQVQDEPAARMDGGTATIGEPVPQLGRLVDWGLSEPWQVALILPIGFDDYRVIASDAESFAEGAQIALIGEVVSTTRTSFAQRAPKSEVDIRLQDATRVTLTWFGDVRDITAKLKIGRAVAVQGELRVFNGRWFMSSPARIEHRWQGRCRPRYPSMNKVMAADTLRDRVVSLLRTHLDEAAARIVGMFEDLATEAEILEAIDAPVGTESVQRLLVRAHCPHDPLTGERAIAAMERVAAMITVKMLVDSHGKIEGKPRRPLQLNLKPILMRWPFRPTRAQWDAVMRMQAVFTRPEASSMLLSGDVGSGKTLCYLSLAVAVVGAGGRVAVILPSEPLAKQVHATLTESFKEIGSDLVTGSSGVAASTKSVVVGTTAMLFRDMGSAFDLVIADEQQKLGADQRRALTGPATHMLEVTATAIPRTMALARFGLVETVHLAHGHSKKDIRTRVWAPDQVKQLYQGVHETIRAGDRVLVVYPAIDRGKGKNALRSIEEAHDKWERAFPGIVRVLNGRLKPTQISANLADLITGAARIGICTSVIEVGINIPRLRRVVVVHPERFGLTTLHQFRGRLAREGGHGHFDMLLVDTVGEDTMERLSVMETTLDGYEIAKADLRLRGPGEMLANGTRQSGGAISVLYQRELGQENIESMEPIMSAWINRAKSRATKESR